MKNIINPEPTDSLSAGAQPATTETGHTLRCADHDHDPAESHCCTEASPDIDGVLYLTTREVGTVQMPAVVVDLPAWLSLTEAEDVALELLRLVNLSRSRTGDGVALSVESLRLLLEERRA